MGSIWSIYDFCKSKLNFSSEEQWRKRKNTLIKKKEIQRLSEVSYCTFNTVPVMCFAYRYVALFTFAVSDAAFPGDTGVFATFYTEWEREAITKQLLSHLAKLCFHSISYPFAVVWKLHFLKSTLQENLTYFTTTQNVLGPTPSLSYILSFLFTLSSLRIKVVGCTFIYPVLFILKQIRLSYIQFKVFSH